MQEESRKCKRFAQPVHHNHLQFCAGRAGRLFRTQTHRMVQNPKNLEPRLFVLLLLFTNPGKSQTVDGVGQHVAQHGRPRGQTGEVGVVVGALPVNHLRRTNKTTLLFRIISIKA